MDQLVSAHHPGAAGSCLPGGNPLLRHCGRCKRGAVTAFALVPLTLPELTLPERSGDRSAGCCDAVPIRPIRASAGPGGDAAIRAEHDGSITSDTAKKTPAAKRL